MCDFKKMIRMALRRFAAEAMEEAARDDTLLSLEKVI
jgi:hypothetical protein